ncbi:TolC family protein [uncultured Meiothermus sp.]|jgi:outer membrane protein TolC|uniref:TolC family protein n=1 Tax=uncultured Meiothermus sp. TaxID=157471 RepID=UPI00262A8A90|nr:TolC family protein [uncultured Meiothermus sp.]
MQQWMVVLAMLSVPVWAFGPREALAFRSPELGPAQAALEAARQRADAVNWGLSSNLSAGRTDGNNHYSVGVGWQLNFTSRLEAALAIARAERQVRQVRREGQKNALLAHAGLWLAQSRLSASTRRLESSQARLVATQQRVALGAVSAIQREEVALAVRQAELAQRQAQASVYRARAEAARYGLSGDAQAQTLRFVQPEGVAERSPAYQEALAAQQLAQARVEEAGRTLLPEVNVGAGYIGTGAQIQTGASWTGRGPGASFSLGSIPSEVSALPVNPVTGLRPGQNEWKLSLGARLLFPLEALPGLRQLEADRDLAAVRLQRTLDDLSLRLVGARAEIADALEGLSLAQARLELAGRQQALVQARVQAGSASPIEALEAQAGVSEAEAGVAQAWQGYVAASATYLDLTDGEWSVQ